MHDGARDEGNRAGGFVAAVIAAAAGSLLWLRYHSGEPDPATLAPTDLANYYYPIADLVGRRLAQGELPLWNPASCSGVPLLATLQPAVLYPPTWLAAVAPTADALFASLWLQVLLAGVLAASALRAGGLRPAAAGLGGVFYVHACLLGNLAWPPSVGAMAWLPALWLCVEKLVTAPRLRWWVLLAASTGMQLLAGFPQYVVYGFYWLVPYAVVRLVEQRTESGDPARVLARRGAWMLLAVVLGVGLAAAQLLPTAELAGESARGRALTPDEVHYLDSGTFPAKRVLANALDPRPKNPTFDLVAGTGYLGIASLLALAVALVRPDRWRSSLYLLAAGALALLLSDGFLGAGSALFAVYHELPTGGLFRTPERLRFISMICLVILASRGLDRLLRQPPEPRRWALTGVLVSVAIAVTLLGAPGAGWRAALSLALAVALLFSSARVVRTTCAALWVGFVCADLWLATAPAGVLHAYPVEVSEEFRAAFRKARITPEQLAELKALPGHVRVEPVRFFPFHAAGDAHGLHRSSCYEPLAPGQWRELHQVLMPDSPIKGAVANPDPRTSPAFYDVASVARTVRARKGKAFVVPNLDALPRAYLVESATRASRQESFEHIRDQSFDFRRGVLLEDVDEEGPVEARGVGDLPIARVSRYEPERVEIEVAPERSAWLVLTDTFYPGWEAEVDGVSVPVHRANGLYRAVRLEAGARRVVFTYRPTSWRAGLGVSLLSFVGIIGVAWAGRRWGLGPG